MDQQLICPWTCMNGEYGFCVLFRFVSLKSSSRCAPQLFYSSSQLQVNFFGNLRVIQSFLPLMKERSPDVQGRIVFTGTGGGACSPCPPLLTAYMASKFATEAYCQSLQAELFMTYANIKCCMINPGFGKSDSKAFKRCLVLCDDFLWRV